MKSGHLSRYAALTWPPHAKEQLPRAVCLHMQDIHVSVTGSDVDADEARVCHTE